MNTLLYLVLALYTGPKQLTWDFYKGVPDSAQIARGYSANTGYEWNMEVETDEKGKMHFDVSCQLVPEKCWTTTNDERTLSHENVHWRICQLWCNKLRERLKQFEGQPESQYKKAKKLYDYCWKEERGLQTLFDRDTRHGLNAVVEKIWEHRIERDLFKDE